MRVLFRLVAALGLCAGFTGGAMGQGHRGPSQPRAVCAPCVRADMSFLASDELHGRGSATRDEHLAALYVASLFDGFGLAPGGDGGSFLQKAPLPVPLPASAQARLKGFVDTPRTETWNVVGILRGTQAAGRRSAHGKASAEPAAEVDAAEMQDALLLTAHLDHLGLGAGTSGDQIYNGADDDASGTTAVIELARVFARSPRPARTIIFVLFGSEELGGSGNQYFVAHSPVPLSHIVANLEFEMIGRRDPLLPRDGLWLTGYERSNLGPALARHGAALVADPHPAEKFFTRSDNYNLARQGVIAHTVSSFGLHHDYHQPGDDLSGIDFDHLTHSIASMVEPIRWLAQTPWKPQWLPNGRP